MNIYKFLLLFCVDSSISHLSPRQVFCGTKIEQVFIFWIFRGTQGKKQYHQKQHYSYIYPKDHSHCRINTHCKGELQSIPQFCVLLCSMLFGSFRCLQPHCHIPILQLDATMMSVLQLFLLWCTNHLILSSSFCSSLYLFLFLTNPPFSLLDDGE